jgi:hypothetical protein
MKYLFVLLPFLLVFASCETGELLPNQAPDTRIFLDEINLEGQDRLNSVIRLHWTGEDPDGYVTAYELSFDAQNWTQTTATDSTFRLDIPVGSDTIDISFYVRAIDNEQLADPEPALLAIPIKNTPPVALFDTVNVLPDTVFSLLSARWEVSDLDGNETLDSLFLRVNDGAWYGLDPRIDFVSLAPETPEQAGEQSMRVFTGLTPQLQQKLLAGARVGEWNTLSLQVRDIAATFSQIDTSKAFFLRRKTGDLLVIDANGDDSADPLYRGILQQVSPEYDYLNLSENLPSFWNPTFGLFLSLYDQVFWYGDDATLSAFNEQMLLELASISFQEYLNQGGKVLITSKFPSSFVDDPLTANQSSVFGFSPMDSLSTSSGQARTRKDSLARPLPAYAGSYPTLVFSENLTSMDPFYAKDPSQSLYNYVPIASGGWVGPGTLCGRTLYTNGRTNQVFWSVELHKLGGDPDALEAFFQQVLQVEFDW